MFDKIVLASGNAGKLKEFSHLFADLNIEVLPQSQFDTPECPEPYHTFVENALAKARHAAKHSGLPALADDSGICAAALNGAPGVLSARYAGANPKSDAANNKRLSDDVFVVQRTSIFFNNSRSACPLWLSAFLISGSSSAAVQLCSGR